MVRRESGRQVVDLWSECAHPIHLARASRARGLLFSRPALLIAFAFAVMADPVSSVAYAIEAALRALDGDLALLLPTMALVVAVVALVITNYHQLVARFPEGGERRRRPAPPSARAGRSSRSVRSSWTSS